MASLREHPVCGFRRYVGVLSCARYSHGALLSLLLGMLSYNTHTHTNTHTPTLSLSHTHTHTHTHTPTHTHAHVDH